MPETTFRKLLESNFEERLIIQGQMICDVQIIDVNGVDDCFLMLRDW